ncbi:MAG: hypothetical protein ACK5PW_06335 [Burkholderiales bacterium]
MAVSRSTAGAARPVLVNGTASRLAGKRVGSLSGIHGDAAKASNNIVRIPQPGGAASGLNGLRQLLAPIPGQGSTAVRALHGIVPFVRSVGAPLPSPAEAAGVGANLLRFAGSLGTGVVTGLLLGGDTPQRQPGQQLLQRLAQSRANLDQTFEALGGLVTETTGSLDFNGRRAALTSMLATSRQQIQTIAAAQPEKAARELAAVFKRFELRNAGGAGADDQARLAVARDILKRSVRARPATPLRPPDMAARPASTPVSGPVSKIAAPLPQPAARGRHAVQALGEAFRAYKTEPTTNRRADLNDVLARARSLKARDGRQWTPDTLRSYASYVRRAARALYGPSDRTGAPPARLPALGTPSPPAQRRSSLPDRQALVTHTGRVGTPEQIATRQLEATARDLREAAAIYHRRKKTLLAGGDAAALAKEVYDGTRLQMFGVSLEQFQASLKSMQEPGGSNEATVRASESAKSANVSPGMPGPASNNNLIEELRRRIASLPFDTSHLQLVKNGNNGQVGLSVNPDSLGLNPRAAYNKLLREYGEPAVMQTMTSLLIPAPGLNPRGININAENQFKLAKVIFNEPTQKMIAESGEREAENIVVQSLGALVLLQKGLLPSNPENFAAIRNAISDCLAPPEKVVQRYTPPDSTSSIDRAIEDKDLMSKRVSHLSFAALIASMLAKSRIKTIIQPKDRPPFFEIQARLLQLLEDEMARIPSTRSRPEESPAVKPDFEYWAHLSREQRLSVIAGAQARVFGLLEDCGLHVPYFGDKLNNDITEPSYILSAVEGADENSQIDTLISELEYRFTGSLYNLSYHHTGSGPWNDRLVLSIIRHAVSQELILQSSDRAEGPPPQGSFKRWLDMSAEEMRSFLQEPSRQEPIRLWLGLTPKERSIIIERVVREAIDIQ